MRLVKTLVIAAAGIVSLSGCESVSGFDPTALRLEHGALLIAICQDIEANGIGISTVKPGEEWKDYWSTEGDVSIARGDIVNTLSPVAPWEPATGPLSTTAGTDIDIVIPSSDENPTAGVSSYFHLETDVPTDRWVHVDGSLTETPCAQ